MKRTDARRTLLAKFLQTSGPVTLQEVCDRFGLSARTVAKILEDLVEEGSVAKGDFRPERPSPQFCWQANLETLHRTALKRLKAEIEPLSLVEYADFLLRWQHVHPSARLRGKEGLLQVLRQLEGYGTYPLLWKRDILASRVDGFDARWLRELVEDGTLVFGRFCLTGDPAETPGAGTVWCEPASLAHLLIAHEPPAYRWRRWPDRRRNFGDCATVYEAIVQAGGATMEEVLEATGLDAGRTQAALWRLYVGGSVTNTSPGYVLDCTCVSFLTKARALRRYGLRPEVGRWVSCLAFREELTQESLTDDEQWRRKVLGALGAFGIASVPMLTQHFTGVFAQRAGSSPPLDPAPVRRACKELVARGDLVKGFFVRELAGDQYALPGVPEKARPSCREEDAPMVMVNSLDPASLYISVIPVPSVNAYCFPGRFMVLDRGRLAAIVDQKSGSQRRFAVSNIYQPKPLRATDVCRLIDAVADYVRAGGLFDSIEVRVIEDRPAARDPIAEVFLHRGFEVQGTGLRASLDSLRPWDARTLPTPRAAGASEPTTDLIARIQAVLEQIGGVALTRQRNQGRTVLKLKGRLLVNCPDDKDPVFVSVSVREDQSDLAAAIPKKFRPYMHTYSKWGSHVEVRVPKDTDLAGKAFRRLAQVWIKHVTGRMARMTGKRKGQEG